MITTVLRLFVAFCLTAALAAPATAQGVMPVPVPTGSVSFKNELKVPVVIQGVSVVKGATKRGAPIVIAPGKGATEFNVPAGMRNYQVFDGNQPQRDLARNVQVPIFPGRPTALRIQQLPNGQIVVSP